LDGGFAVKRTTIAALSTFGLCVYALAPAAASAQNAQPSRIGQWQADQATLLDAKLAGMKAGLQLTPDQEKLWGPFESAVKDADKSRLDAMRQMIQARQQGERMSPIDHLEAMAGRPSQAATNIKTIADAAKPLYASLDDSQKRSFAVLGRMLVPQRARFGAGMMRRPMGPVERQGGSEE
jgi:LTXXQ motif family protein